MIVLILLVSCLTISTVSAADTNENTIANTQDIELESVNEANLLSNAYDVELVTNINNTNYNEDTNDMYASKNPATDDVNKNEGIYTYNDGETILTDSKITPIINVDDITIKNEENVIIPFNVTDNNGKLISGGAVVTISWENNTLSQYVELENGKGIANFSVGLLIGKISDNKHYIDLPKVLHEAITALSNLFNKNDTSKSITDLNVSKEPIFDISNLFNITIPDYTNIINITTPDITKILNNITIPDIAKILNITDINITKILNNITIPDIAKILNITLPDYTNISNWNISFDTNKIIKIITYLFEKNNGIVFNYTFAPGIYNITIQYIGNETYNDAVNNMGKLIIVSGLNMTANDVLMYYQDGSRYIINLTDYEGNPLTNETITITLNGQKYTRTANANGSASMAINLNAGNYTASASYTPKGSTVANTIENNIIILSTVDGNDLVKVFRNDTQYYATFIDKQGKALPKDTTVTFNINGVMYERKVNENGTAKLNINLGAGEYIITATNPVTGEKHSNNITVLSYIQSSDLVKYYKNESQYVVTILGKDGKAVGAGETVTFNINGVFYTRQTNASGQAKLNINLMPGNYVITAEYKDCKVSNNIEVLSILTATDLVKSTSETKAFGAKLVDGQGNPLANKTVNFNINGVTYNRVTDSQGIAKLNINLQKGEYIITSSYNGQNIANTITVTE